MAFLPHRMRSVLRCLPRVDRWLVAFSGGLDSTVLLRALSELHSDTGAELGAVHVHHGLQVDADVWTGHCRGTCERLGVSLRVLRVAAGPRAGESPEAAARAARYRALAGCIDARTILFTAHHLDDQAETLLLQLLRGAGPEGLAAMPAMVRFAEGWHARPLLEFSRAELHAWALEQGLEWVEDPSNRDTGLDRNYLRHALMPVIARRWPAAARTLARAAQLQADAARLLAGLGYKDLESLQGARPGTLSVGGLLRLERPRRANALRAWIRSRGLPAPAFRHLQAVMDEVLAARRDAAPCVRWPGVEVRRYRDDLYATTPLAPHDPGVRISWDMREPLSMPGRARPLTRSELVAQGLVLPAAGHPVEVGFRLGGERCRLPGSAHSRPLKKLFQEAGVPPWERDRMPLIYVDGRLAGVAGFLVCAGFSPRKSRRDAGHGRP